MLDRYRVLAAVLIGSLALASQKANAVRTIEELDSSLITYGFSWKAQGPTYYPSMYTGFAPRIQDPNRIHFHLARGNQARLTAALDELAVLSYMYNLTARSTTFESMTSSGLVKPLAHRTIDQYNDILNSDAYRIPQTIAQYEAGQITREKFYELALETIVALNPGRTFKINIDLKTRANEWRAGALAALTADGSATEASVAKALTANPKLAVQTANDLMFARINTSSLTPAQIQDLAALAIEAKSVNVANESAFVQHVAKFFDSVTLGRYQFRTLENGAWRTALQCSASSCTLAYTEFTAVYPNGSVLQKVGDRSGNRVPLIREVGQMNFVERSYHDVDHIRTESFYGYIPKMDYTMTGNGIHNPAVRTSLHRAKFSFLHQALGIPATDDTLWLVSRGPVSHGCSRMAAGHVEEVRNVFPSNPRAMPHLIYTANSSTDYDLFDIDGSGKLQVMGVNYPVAYQLDSENGAGYREANGLIEESFKSEPFYQQLYGHDQFQAVNGKFVFSNPYVSYFVGAYSNSGKAQRAAAFSVQKQGDFPLYEQAYEKDKIQLFDIPTLKVSSLDGNGNNTQNKSAQFVRLFGRINACGPFASEFKECDQQRFQSETSSLVSAVK